MRSSDVVIVEISNGVAVLSLNRPERHNAWNLELEHEYFLALDELDEDPRVRAIVVTGTGTSFCPGMDMAVLQARAEGDRSGYADQPRRPLAYALAVRKPLIAAINGGCSGIGLLQALLCDVRFIADEAKVSAPSTTLGLPAEFGLGWLLERVAGHAAAVDLLLSGRRVAGQEAVILGLASRSVPRKDLSELACGYAQQLASNCSPAAMAVVKRQMMLDWTRDRETAESESLRLATLLQEGGGDFGEGVRAFVERRAPQFAPLVAREHDTITPAPSSELMRGHREPWTRRNLTQLGESTGVPRPCHRGAGAPPIDGSVIDIPVSELMRRMGIVITEASPGRVTATMPVEGNRQTASVLNGGASCVLAESIGSYAANLAATPDAYAVGVDINATHHRAVSSGTVTAVATPLHVGRRVATYEVRITDDRSRPVCTARITCLVSNRESG